MEGPAAAVAVAAADWPLRKICEPHETNDVVILQNDAENEDDIIWPLPPPQGNRRLVEMVRDRAEDYRQKPSMEKPLVSVQILKEWRHNQRPPGRFLVAEKGTQPVLWKDVGDKKARSFISQLLKHPPPTAKENSNYTFITKNGVLQLGREMDEKAILSDHKQGDSSSTKSNPEHSPGLANKLYERESHIQKLRQAFERTLGTKDGGEDNPAELVVIYGPSGSGKSELARSMKAFVSSPIGDRDGFFLLGKFEQQHPKDRAFSAFLVAMRQLTIQIMQRRDIAWEQEIRQKIYSAVELSEISLLVEAMPFLEKFLDYHAQSDYGGGGGGGKAMDKNNKERFATAFRRFITSILDPQRHPIILVLDDIQWADEGSLDLLQSLVSTEVGNRRPGLMILCTCKGNEVSTDDAPFSELCQSLKSKGVLITHVEVTNLNAASLSAMMADAGLPIDQSAALAEAVHTQTKGNAFLSTQVLQCLQEQGVLEQHKFGDDAEWEWDEDDFLLEADAGYDEQIVHLLQRQIMNLPKEVQYVLKVAACIGGEIRESLLVYATTNVASSNVLLALSIAEQRGIIDYNFDVGVGSFAHDKFLEAAYELIPEDERAAFQLRIGETLRSRLPEEEFNDNLLLVANLLVRGMDLIESEDERARLSRLCLYAARKAAKAAAYISAMQYINYGINLLPKRNWRDQYELSLHLYSLGAEISYCKSDYDTVHQLTRAVFDHARCPDDKIQAYTSLILSKEAVMELKDGMELCFKVLAQYGVRFPRKPTKVHLLLDFYKTRRSLAGKTANDILNLEPIRDSNALIAMSIIHLLYPIMVVENFVLSPLAAFRLIRLTMQHGLSSMSSVGFGFYAAVLARAGKIDEGYFYGELALRIMHKYPVKEFEGRTLFAVWGFVKTEYEGLSYCLVPMMAAHHSAMNTGDFGGGSIAMLIHTAVSLFIGQRLDKIVEGIDDAIQRLKDYNQRAQFGLLICLRNTCRKLMDRPDDSSGGYPDEVPYGSMLPVVYISFQLYEAVYLNDIELAGVLIRKFEKSNPGPVLPVMHNYFVFYKAIVTAASSGPRSLIRQWQARKLLQYLERAMLRCPENYTNKVFLVKAEIAASRGCLEEAGMQYDRSIHYAAKDKFPNEQALACERAATMYVTFGLPLEAAIYYSQAIKLYKQWGAEVKVKQLEEIMKEKHIAVC